MKKPVHVTDHAVLRYLERVGGFDVEGLRLDMQRRMTQSAANLGVQCVIVDGHRFVIKATKAELVVVTVLDKGDFALMHEAAE
jgi:hypothetical protein